MAVTYRNLKYMTIFQILLVLDTILIFGFFFLYIYKTVITFREIPSVDYFTNSPFFKNNNENVLYWEEQTMYGKNIVKRMSQQGNKAESTEQDARGCADEQHYGIKNMKEPKKFQEILKYTWVATKGNDIHSKLDEFGEFLTSTRQNASAQKSMNFKAFAKYTELYEGDSVFFQKVHSLRNARLYFLPWTHTIKEWLCMDFTAKQNIVNQFLPVKEYHPTFLSHHFMAKLGNDMNRSSSIIPEAVPLRAKAGTLKKKVNTFFFGYHGMTPHKPKFYAPLALSGGWNLTKDCILQKCNRLPDMLTYLIVLEADKYRISVGTYGRIHIPDTEQRIVMSCCYSKHTRLYSQNNKYVFVNALFDMTQNWVKEIYHGLAESLTKLALFAPFLRQNPDIHLHFTPNKYSKALIEIVTDMLNLKNPILMYEFERVEANTVYVPPGMHCLRGGDLMSVQLTSYFFRQWTENSFKGNTTQNVVIILKRSKRHLINYDDIYRMVESEVKQTDGVLRLYEFYDKNLPPVDVVAQLFYRAKAIIGVHGAGLTNMIFARPGTHLLEILCPSKSPVYKEMAYKLGLFHYASLSLRGSSCFSKGPLANVTEIQDMLSVVFEKIKKLNKKVL